MKEKIIKIMLGWIENNEPIETTADKLLDLFDVGDSIEVCGTCGGADFAHYGFCPKCDTDAYSY